MQVYRGMDIGTAKPSASEQATVAHHLVDVAEPSEEWSVARTRSRPAPRLGEIEARGHRGLLVGGTGLYVRSVIDDLRIPGEDLIRRAELEVATEDLDGLGAAFASSRISTRSLRPVSSPSIAAASCARSK